MFALWALTGYGHVMSTLWFGMDREYRPVIAAHRMRMLGSLAIVPAATAAIPLGSAGLSAWIVAAYLAWVAYHYHCQNYGILSFAAAHDVAPEPHTGLAAAQPPALESMSERRRIAA